jgi:hypothetical protein
MRTFTLKIVMIFSTLFLAIHDRVAAQNDMKKEAVMVAAEDLKWTAIPGGSSGAMSAPLWGDVTKGPYGGFTKFPAGFKAPMHNHTNDTKIVVVKGAYIFNGKKYGPGSFLLVPGGTNHTSAGPEDSETIFYLEQPGPFDLNPVEATK